MNEYEKLSAICNKIWYKINSEWYFSFDDNWNLWILNRLDDRYLLSIQIIFTKKFMNKLDDFIIDCYPALCVPICGWKQEMLDIIKVELCNNLDNPVDYIYNLIK